jgi:Flp pilus assembly protein TadD
MTDLLPDLEVAALLQRALEHHAAGRLAEAEDAYRRILGPFPRHAQALGMLALILADGPDEAAAEAIIRRHLTVRPNDGASLHALGRLRARQGDDAAAAALFRHAADRLSNLAPIHNDLGVALDRLGRHDEALAALGQALALDPAYAVARGNLGMTLFAAGRFDAAVDVLLATLAETSDALRDARPALLGALSRAARRTDRLAEAEAAARAALAARPDDAKLVEQLALILDASKRPQKALALRSDLARRTGPQRGGRADGGEDRTVLVLGAVGAGHVPTRYLIDPQIFATVSITLLSRDEPDAPLGHVDIEALAGVDVVFSTLGDVDRDGGQFDAAAALCERLAKPVINPPGGILKTGRDSASALFHGIEGMVTPEVRRIEPDTLAAFRIERPMLIRPAGDHGGENLVLLRDEADKTAYLATGPGERLLLTPFHDFRSPDGFWRKYRLIFVDRQVYPFHLAIGEDWLLHYWRADMARSDWKRAEEERFLADWQGVFGPRAAAAVQEAARRLDLDYGGMDCALTADGRVLLFEANACLLLHLDDPAAAFPYKHRHVPRIRSAFTRLVFERSASAEAEGQRPPR